MRVLQRTGQQALLPLLRPYAAAVAALQVLERDRPVGSAGPEDRAREGSVATSASLLSDHPMTLVAPCVLRDRPEIPADGSGTSGICSSSAPACAARWRRPGSASTRAWRRRRCSIGPAPRRFRPPCARSSRRTSRHWRPGPNAAPTTTATGPICWPPSWRALTPGWPRPSCCTIPAIEGARRQRFLHEEAIAHELAGRCRLASGLEHTAQRYLQEARAAFSRWGAAAKVDALDERVPPAGGGLRLAFPGHDVQ